MRYPDGAPTRGADQALDPGLRYVTEDRDAGPDALLMARAKNGDREAFGAVVDRYKDPIVAYLARLTGCRERAQDLAQETFLRLLRTVPRYEERGQLTALLYRIATNLVRSEERRARVLRFVPLDGSGREPEGAPPQDRVAEKELRAQVARAVLALPLKFRVPLVMHEVEGWTVPEIAEALECRQGTVKSRISRARERLRQKLSPYWEGGAA